VSGKDLNVKRILQSKAVVMSMVVCRGRPGVVWSWIPPRWYGRGRQENCGKDVLSGSHRCAKYVTSYYSVMLLPILCQ